MTQSKQQFIRAVQMCGLTLFFGQVTISTSVAADFQQNQVFYSDIPSPNLTAKKMSIAESDVETIKTWLLGDLRRAIWGIGLIFSERTAVVLKQPNAKLELTKIVARQDLSPSLRIYAHQILVQGGQPANPSLVEAYCQTMQSNNEKLYHDIWGMPGHGLGVFGKTLLGYGQKALPCLSHLLNDNNQLKYATSESGAISDMFMHYRVSDLAAYFITQILNLPYNNDANPAVRDQQIQALRQRVRSSL